MDRECVKSIILCIAIIICILEAIVILWLRYRKSKQIDIEETIGFFRIISENPRLFNCRDESV